MRDTLEALPHDGLDHDGGGTRIARPVDGAIELLDLEDRGVVGEEHLRVEAGARGGRAGVVGLQTLKLLVLREKRYEDATAGRGHGIAGGGFYPTARSASFVLT